MYQIVKLPPEAQKNLSWLLSTRKSSSSAFPVAVAYVVAQSLPIPAEVLNDKVTYYRNSVSLGVMRVLSQLNELVTFDSAEATKLVQAFYLYRLDAAFPAEYPLAFRAGMGIRDFFGLSRSFSDEVLNKIEEGCEELTALVRSVQSIVTGLRQINLSEQDKADIAAGGGNVN